MALNEDTGTGFNVGVATPEFPVLESPGVESPEAPDVAGPFSLFNVTKGESVEDTSFSESFLENLMNKAARRYLGPDKEETLLGEEARNVLEKIANIGDDIVTVYDFVQEVPGKVDWVTDTLLEYKYDISKEEATMVREYFESDAYIASASGVTVVPEYKTTYLDYPVGEGPPELKTEVTDSVIVEELPPPPDPEDYVDIYKTLYPGVTSAGVSAIIAADLASKTPIVTLYDAPSVPSDLLLSPTIPADQAEIIDTVVDYTSAVKDTAKAVTDKTADVANFAKDAASWATAILTLDSFVSDPNVKTGIYAGSAAANLAANVYGSQAATAVAGVMNPITWALAAVDALKFIRGLDQDYRRSQAVMGYKDGTFTIDYLGGADKGSPDWAYGQANAAADVLNMMVKDYGFSINEEKFRKVFGEVGNEFMNKAYITDSPAYAKQGGRNASYSGADLVYSLIKGGAFNITDKTPKELYASPLSSMNFISELVKKTNDRAVAYYIRDSKTPDLGTSYYKIMDPEYFQGLTDEGFFKKDQPYSTYIDIPSGTISSYNANNFKFSELKGGGYSISPETSTLDSIKLTAMSTKEYKNFATNF